MITLAPPTWFEIYEAMSLDIEKAIRAGRIEDAFKWLNVMDLIDSENADWFREYGWELFSHGPETLNAQQSSTINLI